MEFRETLLAAQRNQQQKSSESTYYKARFDPPKKEQRPKDRLSANIQKFLAKKDEEEKQKKLEAQRKRDELLAMRDPKALRKIQKTLKVIKSANKSAIQDAVDHEHTAVTRAGPDQPDQDDYGYESQENAAYYEKIMQKYSKIPDEPKFPTATKTVKRDINGTIERVKHALQHEDDPVPHKRKRRTHDGDRESSPPTKYEPEKKKDEKPEKPKFRKPAPPPMDFNELLKLAEKKKSEPLEVALKKPKPEATASSSSEPERLMTKKQKREYEEEMARRQRQRERLEAEKSGKKIQKDDRPVEREKKPMGFGRIPKIGEKANNKNDSPKSHDRDRERDKERHERERVEKIRQEKERAKEKEIEKLEREKERIDREKDRIDRERLERLKAERERIDREMERLRKDKDNVDKTKSKLESKPVDRSKLPLDRSKLSARDDAKKSIDLKSQNTYRIDKNSNEKKVSVNKGDSRVVNGHSSQGKLVPKQLPPKDKSLLAKKFDGSPKTNGHVRPENGRSVLDKPVAGKGDRRPVPAGPSKGKMTNSFDFDKHVNSLKSKSKQFPPGDVKRKQQAAKAKRRLHSDSEYDSEMDDFIDDGDDGHDYSREIREIFGYDKTKYRHIDDDDDPNMESNFVQVEKEEFFSKKAGIMEDLEDMRLEAMMKAKKGKKKRQISDDY